MKVEGGFVFFFNVEVGASFGLFVCEFVGCVDVF